MIVNQEYKSRFRILKGGNISLVVSALAMSVTMTTPIIAATPEWIGVSLGDTNATYTLTHNIIENNNTANMVGVKITKDSTNGITTLADGISIDLNASGKDKNVCGVQTEDLNRSSIINLGTISVDGNSSAYGIEVQNIKNTSIMNSGTINVNSNDSYVAGIMLYDNIEGNASVVNSGTITATSKKGDTYGIAIYNNMRDNASIVNSGTITAKSKQGYAYGIKAYDMDDNTSIVNSGTITTISEKDNAYGIEAYYIKDNASVVNSGTITATSEVNHAFGMTTYNIYANASMLNAGTITVESKSGNIYGMSISNMYNNTSISNSGTITANNEQGDASGIKIRYMYDNTSSLNSGTITAKSEKGDTLGITVYSMNNNASVSNSGTITVESKSGNVFGMYADMDDNTSISNIGTITAKSESGDAFGIYANMDENTSLLNSGTIVAMKTDSNSTSAGIVVNRGTITNTGSITGEYAIYAGTKKTTVNNFGVLRGNINGTGLIVTNKKGAFISLPSSAKATVGDFINENGATLQVALSGSAGTVDYSKLTTKTATLEDDSTVDFVLTSNFLHNTSSDYNLSGVINATTLDVNTTSINVTDNSAMVSFAAMKNGNNLDFQMHKESMTNVVLATTGGKNVASVATTLDAMSASATGEIATFLDSVMLLETGSDVVHAMTQVSPVGVTAMKRVSVNTMDAMSAVITSRQSTVRGLGVTDKALSDKNIWIKPFGSSTKQNNVEDVKGFSANTYGLGFGLDTQYNDDARVGLAVFYTEANVDTNDIEQENDVDVLSLIVYGNNPIIDDKTSLYYQIGYSNQKTQSSRYINTSQLTAKADYTAQSYFAQVKLLRDFNTGGLIEVIPSITSSYQYYSSPSYTESGAGDLGLNVKSFDANSFILGIGSDFNYAINHNMKFVSNIALDYDFNNGAQTIHSNFLGGGAVFTTKGIENNALIYRVGAGMNYKVSKDISLDFKYDFDGRGDDFKNHLVSAKFTYKL